MKYLSIQDAVRKYDTSQTTITRFARMHQKTKNVKKENRKYLILDSFLANHFQVKTNHLDSLTIQTSNQSEPKKESSTKEKELELVTILKSQNEFLKSQITSKDVQLTEKDKQIDKLLQRQSEQNIIIQTMQNRFENLQNGINNGVKMLSETVKEQKTVPYTVTEKGNDNGFTIASAILILLAVALLVLFVVYK